MLRLLFVGDYHGQSGGCYRTSILLLGDVEDRLLRILIDQRLQKGILQRAAIQVLVVVP